MTPVETAHEIGRLLGALVQGPRRPRAMAVQAFERFMASAPVRLIADLEAARTAGEATPTSDPGSTAVLLGIDIDAPPREDVPWGIEAQEQARKRVHRLAGAAE